MGPFPRARISIFFVRKFQIPDKMGRLACLIIRESSDLLILAKLFAYIQYRQYITRITL